MLTAGSACGFGGILGSRYTEETSQGRFSAERGPSGESHQHNMTEGTVSCISQQCCQKTLALLLTLQPTWLLPPFRCLAHTLCLKFRETAHLIVTPAWNQEDQRLGLKSLTYQMNGLMSRLFTL